MMPKLTFTATPVVCRAWLTPSAIAPSCTPSPTTSASSTPLTSFPMSSTANLHQPSAALPAGGRPASVPGALRQSCLARFGNGGWPATRRVSRVVSYLYTSPTRSAVLDDAPTPQRQALLRADRPGHAHTQPGARRPARTRARRASGVADGACPPVAAGMTPRVEVTGYALFPCSGPRPSMVSALLPSTPRLDYPRIKGASTDA